MDSFKLFNCILASLLIFAFMQIRLINGDDLATSGLSTAPETNINNTDHLKYPYCFRFSWLGPKYNNESNYKNATCDDVLRGAKGVPCILPLVVTENSNPPDTNWVWDNFKTAPANVACRLVRGEVCARFSYTYNGAVENITYMCTKISIDGEGAAPPGCYMQKENSTGREIEVCSCESRSGEYPCNVGQKVFTTNFFIFILINIFILFNCNVIKFT